MLPPALTSIAPANVEKPVEYSPTTPPLAVMPSGVPITLYGSPGFPVNPKAS